MQVILYVLSSTVCVCNSYAVFHADKLRFSLCSPRAHHSTSRVSSACDDTGFPFVRSSYKRHCFCSVFLPCLRLRFLLMHVLLCSFSRPESLIWSKQFGGLLCTPLSLVYPIPCQSYGCPGWSLKPCKYGSQECYDSPMAFTISVNFALKQIRLYFVGRRDARYLSVAANA